METTRSEAVVLRRVPYGEADLVVTLLCRDHGKLSALARSARRSQRRFGGALELFTVSTAHLRPHRGELFTLTAAETVATFLGIARDVAGLAHASYGTELVRELCAPEQPDPALFDLLVDLYRTLDQRGARPDVLRVFEMALLATLGLAPSVDVCAACGRGGQALDRGALLDPARGGAVCSACAPASRGGVRPLGAGARDVLVRAQGAAAGGRSLREVDLALGEDAVDARDAMVALVSHHVGKPLRTLEFLGKMNRPGP